MKKLFGAVCCVLFGVCLLAAQEKPTAYINARIIPIVGQPIEQGILLIQNGKIIAVGDARTVRVDSNVQVIDLNGKTIMPGLVDSHSHIGEPAGADGSSPIQPDVRILDSVNARASSIKRAQSGGITTVNVMPGSGHLDSGQTLYLKLRGGANKIEDLLIYDADGKYMGGIKFANGTNSMRGTGGFPGTRAKSVALVREQFIKAREYRDKIKKANGDQSKMPPRDLAMEALVEVLDGKRIVHFHTHRHDDIMSVLRLQKEFGFRVVLHHVSEGWKVADEIAKAGIPCSIILIDSPGGKLETTNIRFETPAKLKQAGIPVALQSGYETYVPKTRVVLFEAAVAAANGMSRRDALATITIDAAKILGLDNRIGSLAAGKDADVAMYDGDPFEYATHCTGTIINGQIVSDIVR